VHLGRKAKDQPVESESSALRAAVDRLSSLSLASLAVEVMATAFTGEAGDDDDEPPWVDPFGRGPSAYEVANWLYLPRDEELAYADWGTRDLDRAWETHPPVAQYRRLTFPCCREGCPRRLARFPCARVGGLSCTRRAYAALMR
jgi:hypothetical protein